MKKFIIFILFIAIFYGAQPADALTKYAKSPKILVGLYSTDDWAQLTVNDAYSIKSDGAILKSILANEIVAIKYDKATSLYNIKYNDEIITAPDFLKIIPAHKNKVVTLINYENRPEWNPELNDNAFLGRLQMRYAEATDTTWVIEKVGLENYVKGVAEATDANDADYLKTLYTAARSYALWHYTYPTKHANENYTLGTTANDQVYKGYNFMQRAPNIQQAAADTKGMIVTYDNDIAVTPYFSNSDGRTRSFSEVWNSDYAYLISVDDPGCAGMTLLGHGVGLSALGAVYFADQGWGWKKILKYYYTGVKIQNIY